MTFGERLKAPIFSEQTNWMLSEDNPINLDLFAWQFVDGKLAFNLPQKRAKGRKDLADLGKKVIC
ncbi:hypothetical protein Tcan_16177 [Toxocara canis]|uniref:Uncharacterized protein n=1 Tax=Toxocara canis TaxID=6265 RepID=A0A0B2VUB6_TOXCA|nr:hypothetical protein Tcan_16177 [Toxocara canis]